MIPENSLVERAVMGFDIKGFSQWSARLQADAQQAMFEMLQFSAKAAGLDFAAILVEETGDGALLVLPPDTDLVMLVTEFVAKLEVRLRTHNEDRLPLAHLRMRAALHTDAIRRSNGRFSGPALSDLTRLLDSAPVRDVLTSTSAHLAFIVSDPIYQKVCRSGLGGIQAEQYVQVTVDLPEKKFLQPAHLYVPTGGHISEKGPVHLPEQGEEEAGAQGAAGQDRRSGSVTVTGDDATVYHGVNIRTDSFTGRDGKS